MSSGHFEGLILAAHLHEQLLGKDTLHQLPGMRRDLLQMPVYVHADQAAKAHARADEGRKAPPVRAVRQLDIVRPARREHRFFADDHAGFIGDLAAAHGILKKLVGKAERQMVRGHMEGIIQHQQRTVQQLPRAQRQLPEIVPRKELLQQRLGGAGLPSCFLHTLSSFFSLCIRTSHFFIVSAASCFCKAVIRRISSARLTTAPVFLCHISCHPCHWENPDSFTAYCSRLSGFSMKSNTLIISTPLSL